jgi:hypothetical protein
MIDARQNAAQSILGAMRQRLSKAAGWLIATDAADQDPYLDPVFLHMSPRERADLPLTRWPDEKEASPARSPERLKKMPERTASPTPGLPKEGVDVQQAKRWASAP